MKAIISDIHGNLEALCAVMEDIERHEVKEIICLGDIVGYGPDPEACVDIIMEKTTFCCMGNHDFALLYGPVGFNLMAAEVIAITRGRMEPGSEDNPDAHDAEEKKCANCAQGTEPPCMVISHSSKSRWQYIRKLKKQHKENNTLYVHASPLEPIAEYVMPDRFQKDWNPHRLQRMFHRVPWIAFLGHTHHPCAIDSNLACFYPEEMEYRKILEPDRKYILNAGSVGQPRDRDTRACYILYDEENRTIEWRRIQYDIESVVKKSEAMCGEDNWCAVRLRMGR